MMTQYDPTTRSGGIFTQYIDEFFKQKTEASGYPPECDTEAQKEEYIQNFERAEGIRLSENDIQSNAGLNAETIVNGILPVNDHVLYVNWMYQNDALLQSRTTSVVIAAFTTAQARLKLFEYLNELGPRALYYDTDSVFCVGENGDRDLPIGTLLGELTDELIEKGTGTYISSFVSGGPKFYAYECKLPDGTEQTVCKIKGIRLDHSNSQKNNFRSVSELVSGDTP